MVGLNKRDLLKDVLAVFTKTRNLGSLGNDYSDTLKKVNAA